MFKINTDLSAFAGLSVITENLQKEIEQAGEKLVIATHAKIIEDVNTRLHSSKNTYLSSLKVVRPSNDTWIILLEPKAMWIEEGVAPNTEMIDQTLKGKESKVIPFQHNVVKQEQTTAQASLTQTLKSEMKKKGIPFDRLERDSSGKPKIGRLHSFDVIKNVPKSKFTGQSYLQKVNVYQRQIKNSTGKMSTQRSIMTFRTMSVKQKGTGMWVHPGYAAQKFLDEAFEWAQNKWNNEILPDLLNRTA